MGQWDLDAYPNFLEMRRPSCVIDFARSYGQGTRQLRLHLSLVSRLSSLVSCLFKYLGLLTSSSSANPSSLLFSSRPARVTYRHTSALLTYTLVIQCLFHVFREHYLLPNVASDALISMAGSRFLRRPRLLLPSQLHRHLYPLRLDLPAPDLQIRL